MGDLYLSLEVKGSWLYNDYSFFSRWINLVQLAWHEPTKRLVGGALYDVPEGCVAIELKQLAEMWEIKNADVNLFLSMLIEDKLATVTEECGVLFINMLSRYVRICQDV